MIISIRNLRLKKQKKNGLEIRHLLASHKWCVWTRFEESHLPFSMEGCSWLILTIYMGVSRGLYRYWKEGLHKAQSIRFYLGGINTGCKLFKYYTNENHYETLLIITGGVKIQLCWAWSRRSSRHRGWKSTKKIHHCELYQAFSIHTDPIHISG